MKATITVESILLADGNMHTSVEVRPSLLDLDPTTQGIVKTMLDASGVRGWKKTVETGGQCPPPTRPAPPNLRISEWDQVPHPKEYRQ